MRIRRRWRNGLLRTRCRSATDPLEPLDDLAWLHGIAAPARVVALGEATHGTREFFRMKHRLFRYLAEKEGFTIFAIEANLPEAEAVNAYVVEGRGDAASALAGLHFWTWDTYEVLDLIEWMRRWNADPAHAKVKFYGFDCQFTAVAARAVERYLSAVSPSTAHRYAFELHLLGREGAIRGMPQDDEAARFITRLAALAAAFDANRDSWTREPSDEWQLQRRYVEILRQAALLARHPRQRDLFMAENVQWILAREDGRAVLWAHNGHVARRPSWMGDYLSKALGARYAVIGFEFGWGQFRAHRNVRSPAVEDIAVDSTGGGTFDQMLAKTPIALFVLPMREAPAELHRPMSVREFGSVFTPYALAQITFAVAFDAVVFVRQTTAARPMAFGRAPTARRR